MRQRHATIERSFVCQVVVVALKVRIFVIKGIRTSIVAIEVVDTGFAMTMRVEAPHRDQNRLGVLRADRCDRCLLCLGEREYSVVLVLREVTVDHIFCVSNGIDICVDTFQNRARKIIGTLIQDNEISIVIFSCHRVIAACNAVGLSSLSPIETNFDLILKQLFIRTLSTAHDVDNQLTNIRTVFKLVDPVVIRSEVVRVTTKEVVEDVLNKGNVRRQAAATITTQLRIQPLRFRLNRKRRCDLRERHRIFLICQTPCPVLEPARSRGTIKVTNKERCDCFFGSQCQQIKSHLVFPLCSGIPQKIPDITSA